jgi:hypothetical protein
VNGKHARRQQAPATPRTGVRSPGQDCSGLMIWGSCWPGIAPSGDRHHAEDVLDPTMHEPVIVQQAG